MVNNATDHTFEGNAVLLEYSMKFLGDPSWTSR